MAETSEILALRERIAAIEAENARLRAEQAGLQAFFTASPVSFNVRDRELRFVLSNEEQARLFGLEPGELTGKRMRDFLPEEDTRRIDTEVEAVFRFGLPRTTIITVDGLPGLSRCNYLTVFFPIRNAEGQVEQVGIISGDITDGMVEQRIAAIEQAKSEVFAMLAHELRTPMTAVIGMANLLALESLTDAQHEQVAAIQQGAESAVGILEDLLTMARIQAGTFSLKSGLVDLRVLCREVTTLVRPAAKKKGLTLEIQIADAVPPFIEADVGRLRQVLLNLIDNAVKYTKSGGVQLRVHLSMDLGQSPMVEFEIQDTGPGVPLMQRGNLFDTFSRGKGDSGENSGAGLGLAICRLLIERHGGRIWLGRSDSSGATFQFTLPLQTAKPPEMAASAPTGTPGDLCPKERSLSVLVVEDNALNRRVIELMLSQLGHKTEGVGDGAAALDRVARVGYDIVLMDVQMPVLDGLGATRQIRAMLPTEEQPWIIGLSADIDMENQGRCFEAGMDDFLGKPLTIDQLQRAIGRGAYARDVRGLVSLAGF